MLFNTVLQIITPTQNSFLKKRKKKIRRLAKTVKIKQKRKKKISNLFFIIETATTKQLENNENKTYLMYEKEKLNKQQNNRHKAFEGNCAH